MRPGQHGLDFRLTEVFKFAATDSSRRDSSKTKREGTLGLDLFYNPMEQLISDIRALYSNQLDIKDPRDRKYICFLISSEVL